MFIKLQSKFNKFIKTKKKNISKFIIKKNWKTMINTKMANSVPRHPLSHSSILP
jgi:hypothetical protein